MTIHTTTLSVTATPDLPPSFSTVCQSGLTVTSDVATTVNTVDSATLPDIAQLETRVKAVKQLHLAIREGNFANAWKIMSANLLHPHARYDGLSTVEVATQYANAHPEQKPDVDQFIDQLNSCATLAESRIYPDGSRVYYAETSWPL